MPWLFKGLEQCVGGSFRHRLRLFQNHQTSWRLQRLTGQKSAQLTDLLQSHLRWCPLAHANRLGFRSWDQTTLMVVGGLHPKQVGMVAFFKTPAFARSGVTSAQQTLQETKRCKTPSHPIRTTKQIGGSQSAVLQSRNEEPLRQRLPLQLAEQHLSHSSAFPSQSLSRVRMTCCT